MLLHTHEVPNEPDHYFLHLSPEEARMLIEGLSLTLEQSPDSPSYSVNLGPVLTPAELENLEPLAGEGNGSGLIVP